MQEDIKSVSLKIRENMYNSVADSYAKLEKEYNRTVATFNSMVVLGAINELEFELIKKELDIAVKSTRKIKEILEMGIENSEYQS